MAQVKKIINLNFICPAAVSLQYLSNPRGGAALPPHQFFTCQLTGRPYMRSVDGHQRKTLSWSDYIHPHQLLQLRVKPFIKRSSSKLLFTSTRTNHITCLGSNQHCQSTGSSHRGPSARRPPTSRSLPHRLRFCLLMCTQ